MRYLHRSQVAKMLACSYATVLRLDGKLLHPKIDNDGVYLYEFEEVQRALVEYSKIRGRRPKFVSVRRTAGTDGKKAAYAYKMFAAGASLADIVIELEETPGTIRAWYRDYLRGLTRDQINAFENVKPKLERSTAPVEKIATSEKEEREKRIKKMEKNLAMRNLYDDEPES